MDYGLARELRKKKKRGKKDPECTVPFSFRHDPKKYICTKNFFA